MGKQLQMLKEIAPGIRRVAFMYNPDFAPFAKSFLGSFEAAAQVVAVDPVIIPVHSDAEIETAIDALGREEGGLLIGRLLHRRPSRSGHCGGDAQQSADNLPPARFRQGGWFDVLRASFPDMFRGAAGYVDRILKGDKPADLPVQLPTRYELVINLKTAKALGLDVPQTLLVFANEVIQ